MEFSGSVILAPLTKGGNLPFRRLCLDHGAVVTMSEMAYVRQVVRRSKPELALLRKHPDESAYGVQLAAGKPEEAVKAGLAAVERGASFVDLNCGCPIHDTVKRGMGATLLQRPAAMGRILEALAAALPVPVTVKIRTGWSESKINADEVAKIAEESGAAAITVHGRTREQRYTRAADWDVVRRLTADRGIPVIGNGDLLTWYEVEDRWQAAGCAAVMLGRGALIKPWLFREVAESKEWIPSPVERLAVYWQLAAYMKEHFRDDERGRERAMRFLPWHMGFFCRWRPWPEAEFRAASREHPLLQTRDERPPPDDVLEQLLRDPRPEVHQALADLLWAAPDAAAAAVAAAELASKTPPQAGWAEDVATAQG